MTPSKKRHPSGLPNDERGLWGDGLKVGGGGGKIGRGGESRTYLLSDKREKRRLRERKWLKGETIREQGIEGERMDRASKTQNVAEKHRK